MFPFSFLKRDPDFKDWCCFRQKSFKKGRGIIFFSIKIMSRYATLIIVLYLTACCPPESRSLTLKAENLIYDAISSSGQSTVRCSFDKKTSRGDFECNMKTCFNTTSGLVTQHRVACHRVRNRILTFDERSMNLIRATQVPMNELRMIIKGSWKDWLGLQFIEYLAARTKFY